MLQAGLKTGEQVEALDAPPRPAPAAIDLKRDDNDGPVVSLDQPRSNDANDPGVPPPASDTQPRCFPKLIRQFSQRRLGLIRHLPPRSPPLPIGPAQLISDLGSARLIIS